MPRNSATSRRRVRAANQGQSNGQHQEVETAWDRAWTDFLGDGKGATTQGNYKSYARKIDAYRSEHQITHPDQWTDGVEADFLTQFANDSTRWTYEHALRAFSNWCVRWGRQQPMIRRKRIKLDDLDEPISHLTFAQMSQLRAAAKYQRDKVLLGFFFETGARASEARRARLLQFNRVDRTFMIDQSKQGTRREMPLSEPFWRELIRYVDKGRPPTKQPWLFLTLTQSPDESGEYDYGQLSRSALTAIFRRLRLQLDIPAGQASPQLLRRGRATELIRATRDTHHLMRVLGWSNARSMKRYLAYSLEQDKELLEQVERERG